jgi:hypothetical protein
MFECVVSSAALATTPFSFWMSYEGNIARLGANGRLIRHQGDAGDTRHVQQQLCNLLEVAYSIHCSGNLLFYQHAPGGSYSKVPFRDAAAVAAAFTRCRSLRLQHIEQQCSALRARIRMLEARQAQQRQHEQQQHLAAGIRKVRYKRGYSRYDGTEEADGSSSNSSGSNSGSDSSGSCSSNSNCDDGCSGHRSDSDDYYKQVARHAGLPRNINDAADWTEDDD